jgi:hypothetical protein
MSHNNPSLNNKTNFTGENLPPEIQAQSNNYGVNSSCNYNDNFSMMHDDTTVNDSDTNQNYMPSNKNFASTSHPTNASHAPQYIEQQILYQNSPPPIANISSSLNSLNVVNSSQANNSEIFGFDIPGFKIIIIPVSSPMSLNMAHHYSLDIPGFKIIIIPITIITS